VICVCLRSPVNVFVKGKGKAIPLQAWTCPEGSRRLRLLDFKTGGKVVSPTHRPPLPPPPRKYSWYSFVLAAESTTGPQCGRIMSMKNSSDTIGNRTHDLLACNVVLQPTAPPRAPECILIYVNGTCVSSKDLHWYGSGVDTLCSSGERALERPKNGQMRLGKEKKKKKWVWFMNGVCVLLSRSC